MSLSTMPKLIRSPFISVYTTRLSSDLRGSANTYSSPNSAGGVSNGRKPRADDPHQSKFSREYLASLALNHLSPFSSMALAPNLQARVPLG
ncbi:hypothetical protein HAX54_035169 [Datura stramonium]|uniref:Uncharacterized protein n=1 Tax=Datura stramonium TaxID=4076 RepID=A0ABS8VGM1_DATST|nr:hypothetical protein [Datura stramonium]